MRGAYNGSAPDTLPDDNIIDWSSTSTMEMDNVGGDYWSFTCQMNTGDTLWYKFWTGYDEDTPTEPDGGWEGGFEDEIGIDTRWFIAGTADTVLPMQYYHHSGSTVNQFWRPWEEKTDSIAIYFRTNMWGQIQQDNFDPSLGDTVGVRGGPPIGNTAWDATTVVLTRENSANVDSSFWSGVGYVPKDSVNVNDVQLYKFVFHDPSGVAWENNIGNREFMFTDNMVNTTMDTTLHWSYFDSLAYDPNLSPPVAAVLTFRVSTEAVEGLNLFDRGIGDKIYVIGPNGFDLPNPPDSVQNSDLIEMTFIPALQEWAVSEPFSKQVGQDITYKYFVRWDASRVDTLSPNYIPNLDIRYLTDDAVDSGWEEPSSTGGADRHYIWTDQSQQNVGGEWGFDRHFFNGAPANCWFDTPMDITWSVNMQPATDAATNTNPHLFDPATDSVWVQFDGSLFALSQGWPTFNERAILLEDPDQDMIYTGTYTVDPPGWYQLPFVIAYNGENPGQYITNGGGTDVGRRYYQFVQPDSLVDEGNQFLTSYWPSSYTLNTIDWVQSNLPFEQPPDMTSPLGIDDEKLVPGSFALHQNYPNPFNPSTTIQYEVGKTADVNITIYNVQGQKVKALVNAKKTAGKYTVAWDGKNDASNRIASGVYFMKMKAGDFKQTRKLIMLK
jgi:hypothetical protein